MAYHEDKVKNSITAVMFAAIGNKSKETEFFARMATAGFASREHGHTGRASAILWAPSVGRRRPQAAAAFFQKASRRP